MRYLHKPSLLVRKRLKSTKNQIDSSVNASSELNVSRARARRIFRSDALTQIAAILKPDGWIFGLIAASLVLASAAWAFVFHLQMRLPFHLWQWDHNVLAKGVETIFAIFLWTVVVAALYDALLSRSWKLVRHMADHLWTAYLAGLILLPFAFLAWDEGGLWMMIIVFTFPITATAFDWGKAAMWIRKNNRSIGHRFTRIRRLRAVDLKRQLDRNLPGVYAREFYVLDPIYLFAVLIVFHGAIAGFAYTWQSRHWVMFPDEKGKIAVFRTGDFWVVKQARRVDDILLIDESSIMVKMDDPKFSKIRMTEKSYRLRVIDKDLIKRIGVLGVLAFSSSTGEIE
jgi:hypothetical protein